MTALSSRYALATVTELVPLSSISLRHFRTRAADRSTSSTSPMYGSRWLRNSPSYSSTDRTASPGRSSIQVAA
jgi:hypothetical protein